MIAVHEHSCICKYLHIAVWGDDTAEQTVDTTDGSGRAHVFSSTLKAGQQRHVASGITALTEMLSILM